MVDLEEWEHSKIIEATSLITTHFCWNLSRQSRVGTLRALRRRGPSDLRRVGSRPRATMHNLQSLLYR